MVKWITIFVAAAGFGIAVWVVATAGEEPPNPPAAPPPSVNPFASGVAASGSVEAASRNVAVSAPEPGLVVEVLAEVNQLVQAGDPLFQLDRRSLEAELLQARAERDVAAAMLSELEARPRPEDLPPLRAGVERARARLADAEDRYQDLIRAQGERAASSSEVRRASFAVDVARAEVTEAEALLESVAAGAWEPQVAVQRSAVEQAASRVRAVGLLLERLTVRSPIAGTVLRRNVEPGQYATTDPNQPAMVVGDLSTLRVRAQVDEEDAALVRPGAEAYARLRGSLDTMLKLRMLRIEPLAQPKMSLTGAATERVDTRVIEVVFEVLDPGGAPVYPGQVVDVYIETAPAGSDTGAAGK